MSDKKNIDHLFKDAFNDFEASPDPALWDKISDKLDAKETKRERKGIFFLPWLYKAAGIAAAIVVLFFVGNEFIDTNTNEELTPDQQTTSTSKEDSNDQNTNGNTTNSKVTDSNTNTEQNSSNNPENSSSNTQLKNQEGIANENNLIPDNIQPQNGTNSNIPQGNPLKNAVATQNGTNTNTNPQQLSNNNRNKVNTIQNENVVRQENAVTGTNSIRNNNNKLQTSSSTNASQNGVNANDTYTNSVAQQQNNSANTNGTQNGTNASNATKNATEVTTTVNSNTTAVAQNDTTNAASKNAATNNTSSKTGVDATTNSETTTTENAIAEVKKEEEIKKSLLDEINDLHDLEKDKTEVAEQNQKRWTISPNASPVYYNTLSNGSPIDETFADNTKSGDLNFSYGVNVGYDVSKRLTVRSGIHKVDYSYSTKDIALVPSINGTELTTIAFKTNGVAFDIQDRQVNATSDAAFSQYQLPSTESSIIQKQIEGNLNQRMSYIEVPVELKYALVDKKLGVNVIGGLSTLLLTENSIILDSQELYAELGEATNLNDVSFSTNIGLGIDYKVSDKIEVNFEPMLKYQLNTFSGNTGNFKPYSVGVYTGVSFRF